MAWNQPSEGNPKKRGGQKNIRPLARGLIAGAVVVLSALVVWMIVGRMSENAHDKPKQSTRAKDIKPIRVAAETPTSTVKKAETVSATDAADVQKQVVEEKKPGVFAPGMIRLPNGFELRLPRLAPQASQ